MTENREGDLRPPPGASAEDHPARGEARWTGGDPEGEPRWGHVPTGVLLAWLVAQNLWAFRRRRGSGLSDPAEHAEQARRSS